MLKIPAPRLLPATIVAMAALLLLKCGMLLQAAATHGPRPDGVMVAAANAASTDQTKEPAKPGAPPAPQKAAAPTGSGAATSGAAAPATSGAAAPAASGRSAARDDPPPVSESERALLQDLRQRRLELDAQAAAIKTRESLLVATEQKLSARLTELQTLQKKLEGLDAAQKQKEEAGWRGLVKLYEDMKPKDAATILNDLSMPVLLQLMDRMKDAKAALVMAAMNPDKARDVTAQLAQMRTGRDASGAPVAGLKFDLTGG
jgi:flagellar motility protein MotE (MotC chaperone)